MTRVAAAVLAAFVFLAACGSGEPGIRATVVDESGNPLPQVNLVIRASRDGRLAEVVTSGFTDEAGVLEARVFEPGDYVVRNLHTVGEPPCWWEVGDQEVSVGSGTAKIEIEAVEVCT